MSAARSLRITALVFAVAALTQCRHPDDSPACTFKYEMEGDSQANARLFDARGEIVNRVDIHVETRCGDAVRVEVKHRDPKAQLLVPEEACVEATSDSRRQAIWFDYTADCDCNEAWEWIATDKAPPVKFPIQIQTVPSCGGT